MLDFSVWLRTPFDYSVVAVMGFSTVFALWRGLLHELSALLSWGLAYLAAQLGYATLIPWLPAEIPSLPLKSAVAFGLILLIVGFLLSLLTAAFRLTIRSAGAFPFDHLLGGLFGLVRGLALLVLFVAFGGLTSLPKQTFWREAALSSALQELVELCRPYLPARIAVGIRYDSESSDLI